VTRAPLHRKPGLLAAAAGSGNPLRSGEQALYFTSIDRLTVDDAITVAAEEDAITVAAVVDTATAAAVLSATTIVVVFGTATAAASKGLKHMNSRNWTRSCPPS
jgi:hypothetical protein